MIHLGKGFHIGRSRDKAKIRIELKNPKDKMIAQTTVDVDDFASAVAEILGHKDYDGGKMVEKFFDAIDVYREPEFGEIDNNKVQLTPENQMKARDLFIQIAGFKSAIAKERDGLRDAIAEAESIADSCDSTVTDLESAVDSLSQYL